MPTTTPNWAPIIPPLTEHEWEPEPVLVSFGEFAGDGVASGPPELTLLGNGKLYVYESGELYQAQLERSEVCSLLNTTDPNPCHFAPCPAGGDLGSNNNQAFIDAVFWLDFESNPEF